LRQQSLIALCTGPYSTLPPERLAHSLTAGSLRGPGKLAVPPLVFAKEDESEAILVLHFGRSLCGHDGIVHGGMVATVFDEATARNVSPLSFPLGYPLGLLSSLPLLC
jgi:hypothetical protein